MFSNFQEGISQISFKLLKVCAWNFTQPSKYDSTSGIKISKYVWKKYWGDEAVDRNKHL